MEGQYRSGDGAEVKVSTAESDRRGGRLQLSQTPVHGGPRVIRILPREIENTMVIYSWQGILSCVVSLSPHPPPHPSYPLALCCKASLASIWPNTNLHSFPSHPFFLSSTLPFSSSPQSLFVCLGQYFRSFIASRALLFFCYITLIFTR